MATRTLTNREKVQGAYKWAILFWRGHTAEICDMTCWNSVLGKGKDGQEAWADAWEYCQKEMIRKLEL